MKKKNLFTKILAIAGTVLVWFPILAPFLLSVAVIFTNHVFRFDYLMPAELFPFALVGGGLLISGCTASTFAPETYRLGTWPRSSPADWRPSACRCHRSGIGRN